MSEAKRISRYTEDGGYEELVVYDKEEFERIRKYLLERASKASRLKTVVIQTWPEREG